MRFGASSNTIYGADKLRLGQSLTILQQACAAEATDEVRAEPKTLKHGAGR